MTCQRCQGLMRSEVVGSRRMIQPLVLWACFCCGDRMDATIRFNRMPIRWESESERHARISRQLREVLAEVGR